MAIDFDELTPIIGHRLSKGRAREEIVASFLKEYLPSRVRVEQSAQIIAATGDLSGECDIVVFDPDSPPLYDERSFRVVPVECVYGIMQVRSSLSPSDIPDVAAGIHAAKRLERTAHRPQDGLIHEVTKAYGRGWREYFPTVGHVFSFKSSALVPIAERLAEVEAGIPVEHRVDGIFVLDRGAILNYNRTTGQLDLTPSAASDLFVLRSDQPLLAMLVSLYTVYEVAWRPRIDLSKYFGRDLRCLGETHPPRFRLTPGPSNGRPEVVQRPGFDLFELPQVKDRFSMRGL